MFRQTLRKRATSRPTRMRRAFPIATGVGIGAALMYLFDSRNGRRRRAIARDKSLSMARDLGRAMSRRTRYYAGKGRGLVHEARSDEWTPQAQPNDATIKHKIESEVLRNYPAGGLNVNVEDGVAVLRGQLEQPQQIRALDEDLRRVTGVRGVRNLLHLTGTRSSS